MKDTTTAIYQNVTVVDEMTTADLFFAAIRNEMDLVQLRQSRASEDEADDGEGDQ